jgi:reversibly glycosylated polypeptide / UDP-arabinopyranose mutase
VLVQEDIIPFFQQVKFSDDDKDVFSCMTSLASQVRSGLKMDPYFEKLADGMLAWVDAWRMLNK